MTSTYTRYHESHSLLPFADWLEAEPSNPAPDAPTPDGGDAHLPIGAGELRSPQPMVMTASPRFVTTEGDRSLGSVA